MEYKFDRVAVNNSQLATDHLNKMTKEGWEPIFFFDMGSHQLGVVFKRYPAAKMVPQKIFSAEVELQDAPVKRGPGRPKKVAMED